MIVSKKFTFDMGHRITNHEGKCKNPHGHTYTLEVSLFSEDVTQEKGAKDEGMVMDFSEIKSIVGNFIDEYLDHAFMIDIQDKELLDFFKKNRWKIVEVPFVPTAENMAKWIFETLEELFLKENSEIFLDSVVLWETPTSSVTYWDK